MISILRKYTPLKIKHFFNSLYVNSITGFILSKIFGNKLYVDGIKIDIDKTIINYLYYARIFLKKYERIEINQIKNYLNEYIDTIELGCGIGITSSHILKKLDKKSRFFCFEANPQLYKSLKKNLSLNAKYDNYFYENKLINYKNNNNFFKTEKEFLLSKIDNFQSKNNLVEIESIKLSQIIEKFNIKSYNLVCDIEGSEIFFLLEDKNILKKCKTLIIELHPTNYKNNIYQINDIENLIIDLGFKKIDEQHACKVYIKQ